MSVEQIGVLGGGKLVVSVDKAKKEVLVGVGRQYKGEYGPIGSISTWQASDFGMGDKAYEQNAEKYIYKAFGIIKKPSAPIRIVHA